MHRMSVRKTQIKIFAANFIPSRPISCATYPCIVRISYTKRERDDWLWWMAVTHLNQTKQETHDAKRKRHSVATLWEFYAVTIDFDNQSPSTFPFAFNIVWFTPEHSHSNSFCRCWCCLALVLVREHILFAAISVFVFDSSWSFGSE